MQPLTNWEMEMSEDIEDGQQQRVHAVLKSLRGTTQSGVRRVKLSNLGPMTVHSTDVLRNSEGSSSSVEPWVLPPKVGKELDQDSRSGKIAAWVEERGPKIVSDYLRKFSPNGVPYISPDAAKELIPEYIEDPTDANLDAGAGAGAITHAAWHSLLAKNPEPGKDAVIISIGSPASGKTTGILSGVQQASVGITRETIPHDVAALSKTLDEAIAAGRKPVLMLTYTVDPKINIARAVLRALKEGRTVPLDYMTTAWLNQPKIAAEALDKYGDRIDVYAVDNSGAVGEAKIYAEDVSMALDAVSAYSDKAVIEAYREVLDQYRPTIPANIYDTFLISAFERADVSGAGDGNRGSVSGESEIGDTAGQELKQERKDQARKIAARLPRKSNPQWEQEQKNLGFLPGWIDGKAWQAEMGKGEVSTAHHSVPANVSGRRTLMSDDTKDPQSLPEADPRSQKLIPLEESQAIAEAYLASLIAGAKAWVEAQQKGEAKMPQPATPAMSEEDAAYIAMRLEKMDEQDKASMEACLKAHPGLTPQKYMEMVVAYGF